MKYKTTAKELRRCYNGRAIAIGYCNAQNLLNYEKPTCYTCGVYGWNFDGYEIYEKNVLITTGYRGMFGTRVDYDLLKDYETRAEKIVYSRDSNLTHDAKRDAIHKLLIELIDKVLFDRG